jgi:hypothetical protein
MKSKMIIGYKGTGDMNLAIQRGEVDGRVVSRNPRRSTGRATACGS